MYADPGESTDFLNLRRRCDIPRTMEVRGKTDDIDALLGADISRSSIETQKATLDELASVYKNTVIPLEQAYKFSQLKNNQRSVAEIYAKPSLLFLGPRCVGKTSLINYILGLEGNSSLKIGEEPRSSDFGILDYGSKRRTMSGLTVLSDETKPYKPLEQYGVALSCRLHGMEIPSKALDQMTIIETPGILENVGQQTLGYPYGDVCQWFIDRASLIFVVLDPTKLNACKQLQDMFSRLNEHHGKIKIIVNRADSIDGLNLVRNYGALCWSLKTLMPKVDEPPRVHLVSCCRDRRNNRASAFTEIFQADESSLVRDMKEAIDNQVETTISMILSHATSVETHAVIVDAYLQAFDENRHRLLLWKNGALQADVVDCPDVFDIPQRVGARTSNHDGYLNVLVYRRFFQANPLSSFYNASQTRDGVIFTGSTLLEKAQEAMYKTIPQLLVKYKVAKAKSTENCDLAAKSVSGTIIANTLKTLRSPRKQIADVMTSTSLTSFLVSSPLSMVTQKVQGALKGY